MQMHGLWINYPPSLGMHNYHYRLWSTNKMLESYTHFKQKDNCLICKCNRKVILFVWSLNSRQFCASKLSDSRSCIIIFVLILQMLIPYKILRDNDFIFNDNRSLLFVNVLCVILLSLHYNVKV